MIRDCWHVTGFVGIWEPAVVGSHRWGHETTWDRCPYCPSANQLLWFRCSFYLFLFPFIFLFFLSSLELGYYTPSNFDTQICIFALIFPFTVFYCVFISFFIVCLFRDRGSHIFIIPVIYRDNVSCWHLFIHSGLCPALLSTCPLLIACWLAFLYPQLPGQTLLVSHFFLFFPLCLTLWIYLKIFSHPVGSIKFLMKCTVHKMRWV